MAYFTNTGKQQRRHYACEQTYVLTIQNGEDAGKSKALSL
jgi:hypothetical protein